MVRGKKNGAQVGRSRGSVCPTLRMVLPSADLTGTLLRTPGWNRCGWGWSAPGDRRKERRKTLAVEVQVCLTVPGIHTYT